MVRLAVLFYPMVAILAVATGLALSGVRPNRAAGALIAANGQSRFERITLPKASPYDLPMVEGARDAGLPLVVIDPGHGGFDLGARGQGLEEKNVVLGLALALRDRLLADGGLRVALTRNDDRFLPLDERYEIARKLGASLFLSIHADSAGDEGSVEGASIYTLSNRASDAAARRFAMRENASDHVNGLDLDGKSNAVSSILVDLSQRRTQAQSNRFADLILQEGKGVIDFHSQPLHSATLEVLRAPDVPSVLFESGFITNKADADRLTSNNGREAVARVLARAVRIYFMDRKGVGGDSDAAPVNSQ